MSRRDPRYLRVLVVDDLDVNAKVLQKLLRHCGLDCDIAKNGLESIEMSKFGQHDIVLMDIHMPGMDGVEAMRRIVQSRTPTPPKVIAVTANASCEHRRECKDAGFSDFIAKPVRLDALKSALGLAPV